MKSTFSMKGRCQDQNELEYVNPDGAADVLYIYPKDSLICRDISDIHILDSRFLFPQRCQGVTIIFSAEEEDHNNAFSLCSSGTIDPSVCYRLVNMAHHYSVHFVRVASVQEAIAFVKGMPSNVRLVVDGG